MRSFPSSFLLKRSLSLTGFFLVNQIFLFFAFLSFSLIPNVKQFNEALANNLIQHMKNIDSEEKPSLLKEAFTVNYLKDFKTQIHESANPKIIASFNEAMPISLLSENITLQLKSKSEIRISFLSQKKTLWLKTNAFPHSVFSIPFSISHFIHLKLTFIYSFFMSLVFSIFFAFFIQKQQRSLKALTETIKKIGEGLTPPYLETKGAAHLTCVITAVNQINQILQEQKKEDTLVITGISHDLRGPLSRIRLAAEMLSPKEDFLTEHMLKGLDECTKMLDQFMTYRQPIHLKKMKPINLNDLLDPRSIGDGTTQAKIEIIQAQLNGSVMGNMLDLQRALTNLVVNATRYGRGWIKISTGQLTTTKHQWIQVEDNGAGIEIEEMSELIKPFKRGKHAEGIEGTGLGLAIVKQIVDAHDGTLEISKSEQGGLCIQILLPVINTSTSSNPLLKA